MCLPTHEYDEMVQAHPSPQRVTMCSHAFLETALFPASSVLLGVEQLELLALSVIHCGGWRTSVASYLSEHQTAPRNPSACQPHNVVRARFF